MKTELEIEKYEKPLMEEYFVMSEGTLCANSTTDFTGGNQDYSIDDYSW